MSAADPKLDPLPHATPAVGQILDGPYFNEPMRVETAQAAGNGTWILGLVGLRSNRFRRVTLSAADLAALTARQPGPGFTGDPELLRLGIQAYALGIGFEFDPYFSLSVSRVDPLPHQLEAIYDCMLKLPRVRFLLADDAGAGKTVMAGLLLRELKLRGLVSRTLIVCPANLAFQWQREMRDKFDEKFTVLRGGELRAQYGVNPWLEADQIVTSLDLAKRKDILPSLRQTRWDLVIVDEAHRMSAAAEDRKSQRYRLGEILRDASDHSLLLTATPHNGDPLNFTLFLQLLDRDAFADVKSIQEAMQRRRAPFYLRRVKEAMVYFPERQADGAWRTRPIFTRRIPHVAEFAMEGEEFGLYRAVTDYVKAQSRRAAENAENPRARAVGFLMTLFQRRLASSAHAVRQSLSKRGKRLTEALAKGLRVLDEECDLPDADDLEEMEEAERERWEEKLMLASLAQDASQVRAEIAELERLAAEAERIEAAGAEAKLARLRQLLRDEGFFADPSRRLLIFTEYKDTLDYLVARLREWGFRAGFIHGGMKPGSRDEPGTRLWSEQQFKDGEFQILVATEAAGEGINLQFCSVLFNYDIPWNPNRLEQRMGRIHRYGQPHDCLIFNFVATNTVEGRVLERLLAKLQEIRDALNDDAVFNVVGEVLPAAQVDRVLRDYYAGKLGDEDLEERLLRDVNTQRFKDICQTALEGLATKSLNLEMLVERRARAQERRLVPESIARFLIAAAPHGGMALAADPRLRHAFAPGPTPDGLRRFERDPDWKLPPLARHYPRLSTDRQIADANRLEWVTPGHPLFEALRRQALAAARPALAAGACFYSLRHDQPARLSLHRAQVVDGNGAVVHERLFAIETGAGGDVSVHDPGLLGDLQPAPLPDPLPAVASAPEPESFLQASVLEPFLAGVRAERQAEVARIRDHVEISLTELIARADQDIGRHQEERDHGIEGAAGRLSQAEERQDVLLHRRARRREELSRAEALTLQSVERMTAVLILPHPERGSPALRRLRSNPETEQIAVRAAWAHEEAAGRVVTDVQDQNLGYDLTSLDTQSGELRLIEVKGLAAEEGDILLSPNEHRVAEDRRDCYWLYVVTNCAATPRLRTIPDPAAARWEPVTSVAHYQLSTREMERA